MEMRDEVFSSVGAQDMDRKMYKVSDLDDIEFRCEDVDLSVDAIFRFLIETPIFLSNFNSFEMGSLCENTILIDERQYKGNSLPLPSSPVSERPTRLPVLLRS